jgi:hypothetical protein
MAAKDFSGFMSQTRPTRSRLSTAGPALSTLTVLLRGRAFPPGVHEEPLLPAGDRVGNLRAHARMLGRVST